VTTTLPAPPVTAARVIRIGLLGAARVAESAIVHPARQTPCVELDAVASRTAAKAEAFARGHGVPRWYGSYEALLDDPAIDAIYLAFPTALHAPWTERALAAGKHVLCEKPLAANAAEAGHLAACAAARGRVLLEAMQTRYSSRLRRQRAFIADGLLGRVWRIDACFRVPKIPMAPGDFRLDFSLGGGAALDLGCYAATCLRYLAGEDPVVQSSRARLAVPHVDRWMRADVEFPSGIRGSAECGFRGWYTRRVGVRVEGERGWIQWSTRGLKGRVDGRAVDEPTAPDWLQQRQLEAFIRACRGERGEALPLEDSIGAARMIDDMYRKAGLPLRGSAAA
jgi:predicted dehydrogenase